MQKTHENLLVRRMIECGMVDANQFRHLSEKEYLRSADVQFRQGRLKEAFETYRHQSAVEKVTIVGVAAHRAGDHALALSCFKYSYAKAEGKPEAKADAKAGLIDLGKDSATPLPIATEAMIAVRFYAELRVFGDRMLVHYRMSKKDEDLALAERAFGLARDDRGLYECARERVAIVKANPDSSNIENVFIPLAEMQVKLTIDEAYALFDEILGYLKRVITVYGPSECTEVLTQRFIDIFGNQIKE